MAAGPRPSSLQQRQQGCCHHVAVRALAYKWQRIIWRRWQSRNPYQEALYDAALRKAKSPLVAMLQPIQLGPSPFKNIPIK